MEMKVDAKWLTRKVDTDPDLDAEAVRQDIWQPIATAPRDGSHILVWNANNQTQPPTVAHYFPEGCGWHLSVNYSGDTSEHGMPPTHWTRLPPLPF
jgi:hypothetical protein